LQTLLFLLIVGALSALFRNAKGKKINSNRLSGSMKKWGELPTLFRGVSTPSIPRREIISENANSTSVITAEEPAKRVTQGLQASAELMNTKETETTVPAREVRRLLIPDVKQSQSEMTENLESSSLINGIIWSEILGEPRAKKPYHPGRK